MSPDNRNRVRKGVSTGGQYAAESRSESGLELSGTKPDFKAPGVLDEVAAFAKQLVRKQATSWARENRKHKSFSLTPGLPKQIADDQRDVELFHEMPRERQAQLLPPHMAHLLGKEQRYGRGRVQLADDFDPDPRYAMLGLTAQAEIERSGIPGKITFTRLERAKATFAVEHQGISQNVEMTESYMAYKPSNPEGSDIADHTWRERAITMFRGASVYDGPGDTLLRTMRDHHTNAMLHETMAQSPLRESHQQIIGLDYDERRATILTSPDGPPFHLRLQNAEWELTDTMGRPLDARTASVLVDEVARESGQPGAAAFVNELRGVFAKTDESLHN